MTGKKRRREKEKRRERDAPKVCVQFVGVSKRIKDSIIFRLPNAAIQRGFTCGKHTMRDRTESKKGVAPACLCHRF